MFSSKFYFDVNLNYSIDNICVFSIKFPSFYSFVYEKSISYKWMLYLDNIRTISIDWSTHINSISINTFNIHLSLSINHVHSTIEFIFSAFRTNDLQSFIWSFCFMSFVLYIDILYFPTLSILFKTKIKWRLFFQTVSLN